MIGCRAATAQDDKSAQPTLHSAPGGKTCALPLCNMELKTGLRLNLEN